MKRFIVGSLVVAMMLATTHPLHAAEEKTVRVFFNAACEDCRALVGEQYPTLFGSYDYRMETSDYLNDRSMRTTMADMHRAWNVPFELQSHLEAYVGDNLLIGGHVPEDIIRYLLEHPDAYDRLLVYQDEMHGQTTDYRVWDFQGEIKTYPLNTPITTYLADLSSSAPSSQTAPPSPRPSFSALFPLVTTSAFLDGLNPCAFAVLLFFAAFLFSLRRSRAYVWKMGIVYVSAIFLAYLLIGVGLAQAIAWSGVPHLVAKIGALLLVALGLIHLLGLVLPKFPIRLHIPMATKSTLETWIHRGTFPAAFVAGFLVGLCTFPCSGGIYVAILGMLAAQTSLLKLEGFGWLVWYNLVFVAPLIILLFLAGSRTAAERLERWEQTASRRLKLLGGLVMVVVGLLIFFLFT